LTAKVTASQLVQLAPGERLNDDGQLYWRKNSDGSLSAFQRVKRAGKWVDMRAGRVSSAITRKELTAARASAATLRYAPEPVALAPAPAAKSARGAKPAPEPVQVAALHVKLSPQATLGQVWPGFFEAVQVGGAWTGRNIKGNRLRVEKHLMPSPLWDMPIAQIEPTHVHALLLPLRTSTPDQERKVRGILSKIFTHAIGLGLVKFSPIDTANSLLRNTTKPPTKTNYPAIVDLTELRALAARIASMNGSASVRNALTLQAYTCQRSEEVAGARWEEFDLEAGRWVIPRSRMKIKDRGWPQELVIPSALVEWVKRLPRRGDFVFADAKGEGRIATGSMDKAMREALNMGGKHVPHGWRSSMRTLAKDAADADGRPLFAVAWLDAVQDHLSGSATTDAYERAAAVQGAGRVLAWWAAQLGGL
jgi:integrase